MNNVGELTSQLNKLKKELEELSVKKRDYDTQYRKLQDSIMIKESEIMEIKIKHILNKVHRFKNPRSEDEYFAIPKRADSQYVYGIKFYFYSSRFEISYNTRISVIHEFKDLYEEISEKKFYKYFINEMEELDIYLKPIKDFIK